jgi:hypothetical protein
MNNGVNNNLVNNTNTTSTNTVTNVTPTVSTDPSVSTGGVNTNNTVQQGEQGVVNTNTSVETTNLNVSDSSSQPKKEKKKSNITPILLLIILLLGGYIVYSSKSHKNQIENLTYNCTPITASEEPIKLDLDSTLVKDLYSKVYTNIREDIAQPKFNNEMKLYLAYRQVLESDKYDSNCNLFSATKMEPYTCEVSLNFTPKAFKEETLVQEIKKLYGEDTNLQLDNIQLGTFCIGGYQYIPSRGEFVQGYCSQSSDTPYKVTKTLTEATSTRNTIVLTEVVKYHESEKLSLPSYLKSGTYYYTFRLDLNYNYVLVSKTYEDID